jgi:exopolyphosphatase/guanosine-5'-triphosphate,3'-diphosphate pyrophosphatase
MKQNSCGNRQLMAAIDVGSNTIRLLIGCIDNNKIMRIFKSRAATRLGKDILQTSILNTENINKSINYLQKIKSKCEYYNVSEILAVGTSALREAKNTHNFLEEVKLKTSFEIQIISGIREAELTVKGVMSNFCADNIDVQATKSYLIVDIGGGSTEWVLQNGIQAKGSMPIGAIKTYENFIKSDPPSQHDIDRLKNHIYQVIADYDLTKCLINNSFSQDFDFIATGGTATTIAAIDMGLDEYDADRIHLHQIPRPTLQLLFEQLIAMPLRKRQTIKGLEPDRADIIITGALILLCLMEISKSNKMIVSDFGLLEGLIYERCNLRV